MMTPPKRRRNLRTTLVLTTALMLSSLPALSAGAGANPALLSANGTLVAQNDTVAHGFISLEAKQLQGAEAIVVEGSAPPNSPITMTLLAVVSPELPTIVVSRQDVITDVNGRFRAVIPIASAYERGTILKIVATSLPGVIPASAQLVMNAPNQGVNVPLWATPHPAR
jgi:hypothetical protein